MDGEGTLKTARIMSAIAIAVALAACVGSSRPTGSSRDQLLSDARTGGTAAFFFLPPIAPEPNDATPNEPGLSPAVEIAELPPGTAGVVATFPEGAVRWAGAHYQADWYTTASPLSPGLVYRIRVSLGGTELGYADAQVADDGLELRFLYSEETFPISGDRALPIKFRIGAPAPDADGDLVPDAVDDCPTVPDPDQVDTDSDGTGNACECLGVVCAAAGPCHVAACDSRTGTCSALAAPDGTACDDGDPCTTGDQCVAGACRGGAPLVCAPVDACHIAGACDPATGVCSAPAAPDGTPCQLTTGTGVCQAGACVVASCDTCSCCCGTSGNGSPGTGMSGGGMMSGSP